MNENFGNTRIKVNEIDSFRFYLLSKELFTNPLYRHLNNDERVCYAILRDRMELSRKNGWINKKGEVYLIFTREEMANLICIDVRTLQRVMKKLRDVKLIEEERQGLGKPNLIYICHMELQKISTNNDIFEKTPETLANSRQENLSGLNGKFVWSERTNFPVREENLSGQKLGSNPSGAQPSSLFFSPNDTEYIDTENIDTEGGNLSVRPSVQIPRNKEKTDMTDRQNSPTDEQMAELESILACTRLYNKNLKDLLTDSITNLFYNEKFATKLGIPHCVLKAKLHRIDEEVIDAALSSFENASETTEIKQPDLYFAKCLWSAITESKLRSITHHRNKAHTDLYGCDESTTHDYKS